jgi:hypothetical protein
MPLSEVLSGRLKESKSPTIVGQPLQAWLEEGRQLLSQFRFEEAEICFAKVLNFSRSKSLNQSHTEDFARYLRGQFVISSLGAKRDTQG